MKITTYLQFSITIFVLSATRVALAELVKVYIATQKTEKPQNQHHYTVASPGEAYSAGQKNVGSGGSTWKQEELRALIEENYIAGVRSS